MQASIEQDIARVEWFDTGLSRDDLDAVYHNRSTIDLTPAIGRGLDNLSKFYSAWDDYFARYAAELGKKIDVSGINKARETWGDGVKFYIERTRGLVGSTPAADLLKGLALFRAQTVSKWFYFIHCEIYSAIEQMIVGSRESTSKIKQKYDKICAVASEAQLDDDLFPKLTSVAQMPPEVNITGDVIRVRTALRGMRGASRRFLDFMMARGWIFVLIAVIIILLIVVIVLGVRRLIVAG